MDYHFCPKGIFVIFRTGSSFSRVFWGLLLILGGYHRIACGALAITMAVAFNAKLDAISDVSSFAKDAGWPLELLIVSVALFFAGPGRFRLGASS